MNAIAHPTSAWNAAERALIITLEIKQFIAVTTLASDPIDESEDAKWGRNMLREIAALYEKHCREDGRCEVRLVQRRYDGEPV